MSLKLYEISDEYRSAVESCIDPETGEIDIEAFEREQGKSIELMTQKAINIACMIREWEAESAAIGDVIAGQLKRCKALENRAKRLRDYLADNMLAVGIPAISDPRISVRLRKNPVKVNISEGAVIPEHYCRVIPARLEPDRALIKQAIESGDTVPGVSLTQSTRLDIR